MRKEEKIRYRRLLWAFSLIGTLAFIFANSLTPAVQSGAESGALYMTLWRFFPFLTHALVRKLAHFCEYALLGAHLYYLPHLFSGKGWRLAVLPLGFLVALLDEGLQCFVPGRSAALADTLIDFLGTLFGAVFIFFMMQLFKHLRREGKK